MTDKPFDPYNPDREQRNGYQPEFCGFPDPAYVAPTVREKEEQDKKKLLLTPWVVQNICYEVIKNYMIENTPQSMGYRFKQKYTADDIESDIALDIAFNYRDMVIQKRPAIYVARGDASYSYPTINQTIQANYRESEKTKYAMLQMPVTVSVIATNVGFTEQLAEYISKPLFYLQETVRDDFCLRQFKLAGLSGPQLYLESKDHFVVNIIVHTAFDMFGLVKGDHLKLKTVSHTVFTSCAEQPLLNQ